MLGVRKQLLQAQHDLETKHESLDALIERMLREGKSTSEIEEAVEKMNRIQCVYDSVNRALNLLEV